MTFAANRLFRSNVTTPTRGIVSLSARHVDLEHIRAPLFSWNLDRLMTFLAGGFLEMRPVLEIVKIERSAERRPVLHPVGLLDVAGIACRELLSRLMIVTGITLGMPGHARLQPLTVEPVTEVALGRALRHFLRLHLILHLFGVGMSAMRESFYPELHEPRRKFDSRTGRFDRRGMTYHAHLAVFVVEVPAVTLYTGCVSREYRFGVVGRAGVTGRAVLRFRLVLFPVVIERRHDLYDLRLDQIERRLADGCGRRSGVLRRLVEILFGALTSPDARNQHHPDRRDCTF